MKGQQWSQVMYGYILYNHDEKLLLKKADSDCIGFAPPTLSHPLLVSHYFAPTCTLPLLFYSLLKPTLNQTFNTLKAGTFTGIDADSTFIILCHLKEYQE